MYVQDHRKAMFSQLKPSQRNNHEGYEAQLLGSVTEWHLQIITIHTYWTAEAGRFGKYFIQAASM